MWRHKGSSKCLDLDPHQSRVRWLEFLTLMTWMEFLHYQEESTKPETAKSKVGGWRSASEPRLLYFQSWTLKWQRYKAISFALWYEALLFFFLLTVHFVDPQGLAPDLCELWRGQQGSTCYSAGFFPWPYLCSGIFQWAWKSTVKPENEPSKSLFSCIFTRLRI